MLHLKYQLGGRTDTDNEHLKILFLLFVLKHIAANNRADLTNSSVIFRRCSLRH